MADTMKKSPVKKILLYALGVFILLAVIGRIIGPQDKKSTSLPTSTPPTTDATPAADPNVFTAASMGKDWPFERITRATVYCDKASYALFKDEHGVTYALNGSARGVADKEGFKLIDPIWKDNPELPGTKISIGDLLHRAVERCKEN
jgi:hypothetical protein